MSGLTPRSTAAVSTNVLNVEPACRRPCETRLYWFFFEFGVTATIARIAPLLGSIETSADDGSVLYGSVSWIARRAAICSLRSTVV